MKDLSRRDVLQSAALAAAALAAQACGQTPRPAPQGYEVYATAVGGSVEVELAGVAAGRLKVLEITPRKTLVAPGVGSFDSYAVLFSGPPLTEDPREPVVVSGSGLGRQVINLLRVDRPAKDGTVLYQAAFNIKLDG